MFARAADQREKHVKHEQAEAARVPTAEEFPEHDMIPCYWLRQQRKQRAILALRRDLTCRGGDRDYQRRNPNQEEADFLKVAYDLVFIEKIDRTHHQGDKRRKDKQDIEILAAV